jgi:hypothetical protein
LFLFDFQLDNAIWAYDTSWRLSNSSDALGKVLSRFFDGMYSKSSFICVFYQLYKAKTWSCDWQGLTELHDAVVAAITSDGGCSLRKPIQILATDFLDAPLDCVISMSAGMNRAIGRTLPMDAFRLTPSQPVYYPVTTSQIQLPKLTVGESVCALEPLCIFFESCFFGFRFCLIRFRHPSCRNSDPWTGFRS